MPHARRRCVALDAPRAECSATAGFDAAPDAVLLVDGRGLVRYANRHAEALFGPRVESLGCACLALFALNRDAPLTEVEAAWPELEARARGGAMRLAAKVRSATGTEIPVEVSLWPAARTGPSLTMVQVRDQREASRTARRMQELERQLHQSQKLETMGRLAGGIAHDFNNLLTIISGYAELLAASPTTAQDVRESLGQVSHAAGRAAQLTGQLLAFSRQTTAEPVVVELNRLVRRESEMLRRIVDEDVDLVTRLAPRLPDVRGDAGRLAQVVMNLVLNARDAMPSGGRLTISTTPVSVDVHDAAHPAITEPGAYVLLSVEDTGIGMTPDECERIFEPFYTTKGAGLGTGLGMTTVRSIVQESGGFISVASRVGEGTTVRVYLPAATPGEATGTAGADGASSLGGRETVLLVEDNAAVRALIEVVLTDHGYTVVSASDGDDAVHQLDHAPAPVQLVVSDVVLPHRNGRAVVAYAERLFPQVKALYLSGYTEDTIVRQGILRDDVAFLQKPFTPTALLRAVRDALER